MASSTMTMKLLAFLTMAVALALVSPPRAEGAVSCGMVINEVSPCLGYLRTNGAGGVPAACCAGIRNLNNAAQTTQDRKTACGCLKSAASSMTGLNFNLAGGLPGKCGVNIPYQISPSIDCSKVH